MSATLTFDPNRDPGRRSLAQWYVCVLLLIWTTLHFEASALQLIVALLAAIVIAMTLAWMDAWRTGDAAQWSGGWRRFVDFLPSCVVPALACSMLTSSNDRLAPLLFAVTVSLGSSYLLRGPAGPIFN